jgi:hypothetical protein
MNGKKALRRPNSARVSAGVCQWRTRYRERQRKLLGDESDDDPDPYDPSYIFFVNNLKNEDLLGR